MPIEVKCACGKTLSVAESLQGTTGTCPFCGSSIQYPAREKKTSRIVISMGDATTKIEARGTGPVVTSAKLSDLDEEGKRKLLLAIALSLVAVLAGAFWFWLWGHWKTAQYAESRAGVLVSIQQADDFLAEGSSLQAWHLYRGASRRIEWYLRIVDSDDEEMRAKLAEIKKQIAGLDDGIVVPRSGRSGMTNGRNEPRDVRRGTDIVPKATKSLATLLEEDVTAVYLGIPPTVDGADYMVVGLGVHPDSPIEDFLKIWGEPARKKALRDEPTNRLWTYQAKDGFDLHVRIGNPEMGITPRIVRVLLYDNFVGTVNSFTLVGTTPGLWRRRVGRGEEGSNEMLIRYKNPFEGWVSFDKDGKFTRLKLSFQMRRR